MTCFCLFLIYLYIHLTCVSTGDSPTNLRISLKLNIKNRNKDFQVCTTASCNKTGQIMVKYMDLKTDPCKDFYQFTCGELIKEIPPSKTKIGTIENAREELMQKLKNILEEPPSETKDNFAKQTKMFFQACVDTKAIDNGGAKVLKEVLKMFGGWPLVEGDKWREEEYNLTMIYTKYELHGMLSIFSVWVVEYPTILPSIKPKLVDPYKGNSTTLEIYRQYVLNASLYFGEVEKSDDFVTAVNEVVDFGKSLSECDPGRRSSPNASNLENMKKMFEKTFDIESFFKSYYKNAGLDLAPNETIGIYNLHYFKCLVQLLQVTSKRTIVNYSVWKMIESSSMALPKQFLELTNAFKSQIGLPSQNVIRSESCIDFIAEKLDRALGHLYVIRHLSKATKYKILDQVKRVKNAFKRLIANEKWVSKESKFAMITKIEQMHENVGYPDFLYDPRYFDDDFKGVDFSGQSFLEMFLIVNMMKVKDALKQLKHPGLMIIPVTFYNGYYVPYTNELIFTTATFSPPAYSESSPASLNFGGLGSTMGHELTHAFDKIGGTVVIDGVSKQMWDEKTNENFLKRSKCLINQFDGIPTETNIKVNGSTTIHETISDGGGLRIAYTAYKRWLNEYGEEKQILGFPYNSEQMFFIGYGMQFCRRHTNETPEYKPHGTHPPHKIRTNMSLKNFKTFSKVFKCKANSEMNISKRCRVW